MRITLENMEQLKLAVEKLLDEPSQREQALDRALTTLGLELKDTLDPLDGEVTPSWSGLDLQLVYQLWRREHLERAVRAWLDVQLSNLRYGYRDGNDNARAQRHRSKIDRDLPKLQRALFDVALSMGKVYDN